MSLNKSIKKITEFDGQDPSYDERLDYYAPSNNNNKFWHIRVFGRYVVRQFGRHGTKGQVQVHEAYSSWDAREQADKLYWQKKDKGYTKNQTTVLDQLTRGAEIDEQRVG